MGRTDKATQGQGETRQASDALATNTVCGTPNGCFTPHSGELGCDVELNLSGRKEARVMAKRVVGGLLVGLILGSGVALTQGAQLPPAEVEIAAMEEAFGQVTNFFKGFIVEIKGFLTEFTNETRMSFTTFDERVTSLERTSLILKLGLEEMGARFTKFEGAVVPAIMALEGRVTAIERYDYPSLERRIAALAVTNESLSVQIQNNRTKIEGLEVVLAGLTAAVDGLPAVVEEMRAEMDVLRQEVRQEMDAVQAKIAADQQAMWAAIFLVPLAVGGLLYLLLSQG